MADALDVIPLPLMECTYVGALCVTCFCFMTNSVWLYVVCVCLLYACVKAVRRKSAGTLDIRGQGVFITGCDTGVGHDIALRLDDLGFTVFAGCMKPEEDGARKLRSASSKRLHVVTLDVGSDESMNDAHQYVLNNLPLNGLWGIINTAEINLPGDVELLTLDLYDKAFNVNFYGAVRLMHNFLHLVRQTKGRVVIVSNIRGRFPWPCQSAYHATQHGLEVLSDVLRLEMTKFGVQVSVIETSVFGEMTVGNSQTRLEAEADEMWNAASDDVRQTYGRGYLDCKMLSKDHVSQSKTSVPVIDAMVEVLVSGLPHTHYLVNGGGAFAHHFHLHTILARYYAYLPTWFTDWVISRWSGCHMFPPHTGYNTT